MYANGCKEIKYLYINQQVAIIVQPRLQQRVIFLTRDTTTISPTITCEETTLEI